MKYLNIRKLENGMYLVNHTNNAENSNNSILPNFLECVADILNYAESVCVKETHGLNDKEVRVLADAERLNNRLIEEVKKIKIDISYLVDILSKN